MATQAAVSYDPKARFEVRVVEVEYQPGWLMRLYQPQGTGPFPALLDVHGGAWSGGDRFQNEPADRRLAEMGILVAAPDFRIAPEHPYPAQVQDTHLATRWLKAHAAEFNGTAQGLGAVGTSSGAHTLLLSAMKPEDPRYGALPTLGVRSSPLRGASGPDARVAYVILCWGVLDSWARYQYAKPLRDDSAPRRASGNAAHLARGTEVYFLTEEAMQEGNPQMVLERGERVELPPALIIQGFPDTNIPKAIPERFYETYRKAGGSIEIEWFPGAPHGFMREMTPDTERALGVMGAFIARQLGS